MNVNGELLRDHFSVIFTINMILFKKVFSQRCHMPSFANQQLHDGSTGPHKLGL